VEIWWFKKDTIICGEDLDPGYYVGKQVCIIELKLQLVLLKITKSNKYNEASFQFHSFSLLLDERIKVDFRQTLPTYCNNGLKMLIGEQAIDK